MTRGDHVTAACDAAQPVGHPVHVLVRAQDQARSGDEAVVGAELASQGQLAAALLRPVERHVRLGRVVCVAGDSGGVLVDDAAGGQLVGGLSVGRDGRDQGVVAGRFAQDGARGPHLRRCQTGDIDDGIELPSRQCCCHRQRIIPVGSQRLGPGHVRTTDAAVERGHTMARLERMVRDCAADERGSAQHQDR